MENKELHSFISSSPLALAHPQMAAACINAGMTAEEFDKLHTSMMGEPATATASTQDSNDEDAAEANSLLLSIPSH